MSLPVRRVRVRFIASNVVVWFVMTAILVVVPDWLEQWIPLQIARGIGWAVAAFVWIVSVESQWRARFGPFLRFGLQLILWVGAALVATFISSQARIGV